MPLTFTRTFRVRYYECDPLGHLNNTNYIRYMQETAFDASAAAGYDLKRYAEMKRVWLVHSTEIEYLRPLKYNECVEIKTWVADFRRASSRRMYEFRLAGVAEPVAKAHTDWMFMDTETNRPARVPSAMVDAFFPEGAPASFPTRQPAPNAPLPPVGTYRMRRKVAWHELDTTMVVNNPVYLNYIEDGGFGVIAAHGWPVQRMMAEGFAIIIRSHHIDYRQPARLDDELEVATWASDIRRSTALRHYRITRVQDGAVLAQASSLGVWVDVRSGRPIRIPENFLADFAPNIVTVNFGMD